MWLWKELLFSFLMNKCIRGLVHKHRDMHFSCMILCFFLIRNMAWFYAFSIFVFITQRNTITYINDEGCHYKGYLWMLFPVVPAGQCPAPLPSTITFLLHSLSVPLGVPPLLTAHILFMLLNVKQVIVKSGWWRLLKHGTKISYISKMLWRSE